MGWADKEIRDLQSGKTVWLNPVGHSMEPRVESGDRVCVRPLVKDDRSLEVDDIVLCTVNGHQYLHLILQIGDDGRLLIGNTKGHSNGWITRDYIYGRLIGGSKTVTLPVK